MIIMTVIIPGSNSVALAHSISGISGFNLAQVSSRKFPDGETYVRIDSKLSGEAAIVQSLYPNQNDSIIELILLADAAKNAGAKKLKAVIPYFAYARQDKTFQKGEALSIKAIARILKSAGIEEMIMVDVHFHRKPETFDFYGMCVINISAGKILLDFVRKTIPNFSVIGPDFGSSEIIEFAGGGTLMKKEKFCPLCGKPAFQCKCISVKKSYEVKFLESANFLGKNIVVLDDIIASGTTMIKAVDKLRECNAEKIAVVATHGLFLKDSLKILQEKADMLAVTDSIQTPVSKVSVAPIIAKFL